MPRCQDEDKNLITRLHELVFDDDAISILLNEAFSLACSKFEDKTYSLPYASENVKMDDFFCRLPISLQENIRLCRVFVLKSGMQMPASEIHRNSVQRLVSYRNRGAIHSAAPGGVDMNFTAFPLRSPVPGEASEITSHWDIVPANTWHFPEAYDSGDWLTVTFHSAGADQIIDEYTTQDRPL